MGNINHVSELLYGDDVLIVDGPFKGDRGTVIRIDGPVAIVHLNGGQVITYGDLDKKDHISHRFGFEADELHRESRSIIHEMPKQTRERYGP